MKRIFFSIAMTLCTVITFAQENAASSVESNPEKQKEQIDSLKLSENTVYAEVIEMMTDDNEAISLAQQKSINLLQTHVIEIFAKRMHMEKQDVQEIWDVIDDKCQNIVVKKGDLLRVFSYIMKDALGLSRSKPKEGDVEKYLVDTDTTEIKKDMAVMTDIMLGGKDSINEATPVVVKKDTVPPAPKPAINKEDSVATPVVVEATPVAKPVAVAEPTPVVEAKPEVKPTPEPVKVEIPAFVQPLLEQETYNELMSYLRKEKNRTLMYGNQYDMQNFERCYIAIVDRKSGKVVAVLGKGVSDRINYKTLANDNLLNYRGKDKGYSAIFIQEY